MTSYTCRLKPSVESLEAWTIEAGGLRMLPAPSVAPVSGISRDGRLFCCIILLFGPRGAEVRMRPYCRRRAGVLLPPPRVATPAATSVCGALSVRVYPSCRRRAWTVSRAARPCRCRARSLRARPCFLLLPSASYPSALPLVRPVAALVMAACSAVHAALVQVVV